MSAIKLASDSLIVTPAGGNIEYNGQFFATDSNNERAQLGRLVVGTAQASTSGTSIDFTGIPAWVKRITVMFESVSTNGTNIIIQLGDSGGFETTGYLGGSASLGSSGTGNNVTNGLAVASSGAATSVIHGQTIISNLTGNTWVSSSVHFRSDSAFGNIGGSSKTLSATLDRIRITTSSGTDVFDSGNINILYEG